VHKYRYLILIIGLLLSVFAAMQALEIEGFESMEPRFARAHPVSIAYNKIDKDFS